jgi:hypothetical protein
MVIYKTFLKTYFYVKEFTFNFPNITLSRNSASKFLSISTCAVPENRDGQTSLCLSFPE